MALAVDGRQTGSQKSMSAASGVAASIVREQGPLGQWCWLYDVAQGRVTSTYPVFSVHQDGMAPMALLELEKMTGQSFAENIGQGLDWVFGHNELGTKLCLDDPPLILRDIHRQGQGRIARAAGAIAHCAGWTFGRTLSAGTDKYTLNRECRPYHLGWALYAAALWSERTEWTGGVAAPRAAAEPVGVASQAAQLF